MRKFLLVGALFLAFNFTNAQKHIIKANPMGLASGFANIGYEFVASDSETGTIAGVYFNKNKISGSGLGIEYRFYFSSEAAKGLHGGPSVGILSLSYENNSELVFSIGAETGYQWIIGKHFALDVFGAYGFLVGTDKLNGLDKSVASFGISIGYAW